MVISFFVIYRGPVGYLKFYVVGVEGKAGVRRDPGVGAWSEHLLCFKGFLHQISGRYWALKLFLRRELEIRSG